MGGRDEEKRTEGGQDQIRMGERKGEREGKASQ